MEAIIGLVAVVLGIAIGVGGATAYRDWKTRRHTGMARDTAAQLLEDAEEEKKRVLLQAKEEALQSRDAVESEARQRRKELQRAEDRLDHREEGLDKRQETLERRESQLSEREHEADRAREEVEHLRQEQSRVLESIAGLSAAEAREQIMHRAEARCSTRWPSAITSWSSKSSPRPTRRQRW